MSNSIEERVIKVIAEQLSVDEAQVKPEAAFIDDLGADSLDLVELVMSLEKEFDCEIPDEDAEKNHHRANRYRLRQSQQQRLNGSPGEPR